MVGGRPSSWVAAITATLPAATNRATNARRRPAPRCSARPVPRLCTQISTSISSRTLQGATTTARAPATRCAKMAGLAPSRAPCARWGQTAQTAAGAAVCRQASSRRHHHCHRCRHRHHLLRRRHRCPHRHHFLRRHLHVSWCPRLLYHVSATHQAQSPQICHRRHPHQICHRRRPHRLQPTIQI